MLAYAIRRIAGAIPTILVLVTLTFFLLRLAPGGPFDGDRKWSAEIQANLEKKYHLDDPLHVQFFSWLKGISQGDLGESFQYVGRSVNEIIAMSLPNSVMLSVWALAFAIVIGVPLGCLAAWKQNSWLDHSAMFLAVSGVSLPSFLVASVLILIFSLSLGWLPPALWEGPSSMVLPIITLGCRPMAMLARLTRASMLESLQADYIRTAKGKGLSDATVIFKHALKNSLIPVITIMGPITASLVTGSFLVEEVFQIPGTGKHFVHAVLNRDYTLVMGTTLVYVVVLIGCNLAVDLIYAWVDPRIRLEG